MIGRDAREYRCVSLFWLYSENNSTSCLSEFSGRGKNRIVQDLAFRHYTAKRRGRGEEREGEEGGKTASLGKKRGRRREKKENQRKRKRKRKRKEIEKRKRKRREREDVGGQ